MDSCNYYGNKGGSQYKWARVCIGRGLYTEKVRYEWLGQTSTALLTRRPLFGSSVKPKVNVEVLFYLLLL